MLENNPSIVFNLCNLPNIQASNLQRLLLYLLDAWGHIRD